MTASNPYLLKKRILDKGNLWGFVLEFDGKQFKADVRELLGLIVYYGKTVLVDYSGADRPATVSVIHIRVKDGLRFAFRSIHDGVIKNNISKLPSIKLISANKIKVFKQ